MTTPRRIPSSTYRVQLGAELTLDDLRRAVRYLDRLGISDVYCSPLLQARPGSSHGYDVIDPRRVADGLGTERDLESLSEELRSREMGLLLDVVPNHMAASSENPWWRDVLESGPSSPYAHYFDIQWRGPARREPESQLFLPVLGEHYVKVLQGGQLRLEFGERGFGVSYGERWFPLDLETVGPILEEWLERLRGTLPASHRAIRELAQLLALVSKLPARKVRPPRRVTERHRSKEGIKERLRLLHTEHASTRAPLKATLARLNGRRGQPESFRELHAILDEQCYRLAYWRTARLRLNYRRFFDVNDLVGLRVDDPGVFEARHGTLLAWLRAGLVTGVRIDHVDGLLDPRGYLERLSQRAVDSEGAGPFVVVEKILDAREELREDWPVAGTTGYDFLNAVTRLLVDPVGLERLEQHYRDFTGETADMATVAYRCRKHVTGALFAAELDALAGEIAQLAARDVSARDVSRGELARGLTELAASLPVYRTYVQGDDVSRQDRELIRRTVARARERTAEPDVSGEAFDFLEHVLLFEPSEDSPAQRDRWLRTVGRWQQLTGPVMAKGYEDTACYVHASLLALNEVGSDPERDRAVLGVEAFHAFNARRAARWPSSLSATATHDTKRGEDVRARIAALSELAAEWEQSVKRWSHMNRSLRTEVEGRTIPDGPEEVLLYQTLVGAWPLDARALPGLGERILAHLRKALREAKRHSGWIDPDPHYEAAFLGFAEKLLEPGVGNRFLRDFQRIQQKVAFYGALNGLGQTLLKLAAPGVPDVYQGTELWDESLVDPDNRRPVDLAARLRILEELEDAFEDSPSALLARLLSSWGDGRVKQFLLWRGLQLRRRRSQLFARGDYVPLEITGPRQDNVCAFARRRRKEWCVAAAPRLNAQLVRPGRFPLGKEVWGIGAIALPEGAPERWVDELTGETLETAASERGRALRLFRVFHRFPVALLVGQEGAS
jgi:(1->4)-alpha-D-glucan 1-alpha-D-glucosylmutase